MIKVFDQYKSSWFDCYWVMVKKKIRIKFELVFPILLSVCISTIRRIIIYKHEKHLLLYGGDSLQPAT